ncbi:hypothetical protein KUL72_24835 [Bradyrhizobium arachidis]|uniref:hypothetical protein n=1 Tax=Bradyrhizobium arachidis TaxID=858423 RepID=UPI002161E3E1|nr:hypothetical protein [Bradyrhizobium arachidis]UVO34678.1 hypothetical protein KUL72_24835 [Bradyrhizobium arachidis]
MDAKLMKKLKGGRWNDISVAFWWFEQDYGREPTTLWELVAHLEAIKANGRSIDRSLIDCVIERARRYQPGLVPCREDQGQASRPRQQGG